jgi:SAM-dependent methyltransferase
MADQTHSPRDFYDSVWRTWGHLDAASPAAFHRRRLVVGRAMRGRTSPERILDVGCGRGELLSELGHAFPSARLAGADVSMESLEQTRQVVGGAELFELDLGDPQALTAHPDQLGRYDLVVCSEVLEHLVDDALAARHLRALLGPGGHLVATVPGGKLSRFDEVIGHQRHYRPRELGSLFERAGLTVETVIAWGFPFHTFYRSLVRVASRWSLGPQGGAPGRAGRGLGVLYAWSGALLRPLFYANLSRWGEQLVAVARAPR